MTRTEAERELAKLLKRLDLHIVEDDTGYCAIMGKAWATGHPIWYEPSTGDFLEESRGAAVDSRRLHRRPNARKSIT